MIRFVLERVLYGIKAGYQYSVRLSVFKRCLCQCKRKIRLFAEELNTYGILVIHVFHVTAYISNNYSLAKQMFSGVYWNQPVCGFFHLFVCVQNNSFCQSAGRGIKSHLVTGLVSTCGHLNVHT